MNIVKQQKEYFFAALIFAGLCIFFYHEIIFQMQWLGDDFFTQNYPNRIFAGEEIRQGRFPLWNPFVFSGTPFLADIQTAVLYPFNFFLSPFLRNDVFSFHLYESQVVFHSSLGGFFTFIFLRSLHLDFFSGLIGGIIFGFCGLFINHAHHTNFIHSAIWLPFIFFGCLKGIQNRSLWFWACPLGLTLSLFGGHPQITLYIVYAFSAYFLFLGLTEKRSFVSTFGKLSLCGIIFLLLSSAQILPTVEFLGLTQRSALGFEGAVKDSLPLNSLWTLFFPDLFVSTYESWQRWEFRTHVGIGSIFLAILGMLNYRNHQVKFFSVLGVISMILAFGGHTPFYRIFYEVFPGFQFIRVPARLLFLFIFSISVLAAFGFNRFFRFSLKSHSPAETQKLRKQIILIAIMGTMIPLGGSITFNLSSSIFTDQLIKYLIIAPAVILLFFLIINFKHHFSKLKIILGIILIGDLFLFRGNFNHHDSPLKVMQYLLKGNPIAEILSGYPESTRVQIRTRFPIYSNFGMVYRISNIYGYNPFRLKIYQRINPSSPEGAKILGTRFVDFKNSDEILKSWKIEKFLSLENVFMINNHALPRAFFVSQSKVDPKFDLKSRLKKNDFDPLKTVYLEKGDSKIDNTLKPKFNISLEEYFPNKIKMDLQASSSGYLVASEVFYPGWKVEVNGKDSEILLANSLFRGVKIDERNSKIKFYYQPSSFFLGAWISILTFFGGLSTIIKLNLKSSTSRV